jgi:hypothetical protein
MSASFTSVPTFKRLVDIVQVLPLDPAPSSYISFPPASNTAGLMWAAVVPQYVEGSQSAGYLNCI